MKHKRSDICKNCKYFYQHYIYSGGQYVACNCGHCIQPRMKPRSPGELCEWFERKYVI